MIAEETLLKTDDLAVGSGATYRQVDYWVRNGMLRGVERFMSRGSGTVRYFTFEDFRVACVLVSLSRLGLAGEGLRFIADELYRLLPSMQSKGWAVVEALGLRTSIGRRSPCDVMLRLTTSSSIEARESSYVVAVPGTVVEPS